METMRNVLGILVGKPGGKKLLGRPKYSWEDNIKMNLKEREWKDVEWIHLAQDRVVDSSECNNVPLQSTKDVIS